MWQTGGIHSSGWDMQKSSVESFNSLVMSDTDGFNKCLQNHTLQACTYEEDFMYGLVRTKIQIILLKLVLYNSSIDILLTGDHY